MKTVDISFISVLSLLILVIPIVLINMKLKLGITKRTLNAIIRMCLQLLLVGLFLQYIFELNHWLINILYVCFMMIVASLSVIKSSTLVLKKYFLVILFAIIVPNFIVLSYFNYFVIQLDQIFDAMYLIPVSGMLLGNSLSGIIIGLNKFYSGIKENEKQYLTSLSLSANRLEAIKPYFKEAILASTNPVLASLETLGLVSLPGMMTGQILGGSLPMVAIKYQIAIMLAIFVSRYFSTIVAIYISSLRAFNDYDMLAL
ncbi:ABC transporter permease [Vallitalea okinawensis]|uniref:ABC transporter permease n=1 Tax=Vallitalea okinawensis TaxID=2078660 RepID=UPI000CFCCD88|nr:ABC transporter permease [Vallitalea okinawensis]